MVTSNILVWRGIWNVYDAFLYPEDHFFSDLVSLVLGYVLCILLFFLQWPAGDEEYYWTVSVLILHQFKVLSRTFRSDLNQTRPMFQLNLEDHLRRRHHASRDVDQPPPVEGRLGFVPSLRHT